jgi:hypothetical protein
MLDWEEVEKCEEEEERMFLLKELLRTLPKANQDNIAALFRLLNRLGRYCAQGTAQDTAQDTAQVAAQDTAQVAAQDTAQG